MMYNIIKGGGRSNRKNLVYNVNSGCFFSDEGQELTQISVKEGMRMKSNESTHVGLKEEKCNTAHINNPSFKYWLSGVILTSLITLALLIQTVLTQETTTYQGLVLFFSYYGMLSVALSLIFREKNAPKNECYRPFVSIIIPAKNEECVIETTVRSIAGLNYRKNNKPNYEILVVDDSSTDGTTPILERLAKEIPMLRPLKRNPGDGPPGKSAVLNFGLRHAMGEVIAVFDADTRVEPDFLKIAVPYLFDQKVAGVQGRVRIFNAQENLLTQLQEDEFATFAHMWQISKDVYGGVKILAGNGQVTKRTALEEAGGWNELSATDDMDLTLKFLITGKLVCYCPEAMIWQEGITQMKPLLRQRIRWAEGMLKCLFDYLFPLIAAKGITFMQKFDSIMGVARITIPMIIWIGYLHLFLTYAFSYSFHSSLAQPLVDSLAWLFFIVTSAGLLKYVAKANLFTLLRVPVYWAYNFCWVIAVPVGFMNCIRHFNRIEWDKTDHIGEVAKAARASQLAGSRGSATVDA